MTTAPRAKKRLLWWQYWPVVVAVSVSQFGGLLLARWMPFHYAMALAGFVGWFFVGIVWLPIMSPRFGLPRWLAPLVIGLTAGVAMGLLAYLFPWK